MPFLCWPCLYYHTDSTGSDLKASIICTAPEQALLSDLDLILESTFSHGKKYFPALSTKAAL
jgi:hypothetical protein